MTWTDFGLLCFVPVLVVVYGIFVKRPWQSLTDEEWDEIYYQSEKVGSVGIAMSLVEIKLKEKNK
jgi:hypothetical protein